MKLEAARLAPAPVEVRRYADADRDAWTAFVAQCEQATLFHRIEWKAVMERVFGHRTHFLLADQGGLVTGVLPLAEVYSRLFGHSLVSLPFCVYGGAAASSAAAAHALHARARELAADLNVSHLELRNRVPTEADWPRQDLYETFRKPLLAGEEDNFKALPGKRRNMIRKAEKAGLKAALDGSVDRFYRLYTRNVHRHGTPPVSRGYFEEVARLLGSDHEVLTVTTADGQPLASAFLLYFRDEVCPYYVGDCDQARALAANDYMYWEIIRRAAARGCRTFDWSRSKKGTGSYEFKKLWGFEPAQLHYEYALLRRDSVPQNNPLNPKYRAMIAIWQRLPLPVVNAIGPRLVRSLG